MSRKKKLLLNLSVSTLYQVVSVVCGFILPRAILSRYGSSVNGLVNSISQFLGLISMLDCGVSSVVNASLYGPLAHNDYDAISRVFKSSKKFFRTIAYIFVAYVFALAIVYPFIVLSYFDYLFAASLVVIVSISIFAQYYFGINYRIILNADQRAYIATSFQIITVISNTLISIILIRLGAGIHVVKLAAAACYMIQPIAMKLYVDRHYHIKHDINYSGEPIKQKWNGLAQHFAFIIATKADTLVLTIFSTLENVSIYGVYNLVLTGVADLFDAIQLGFTPLIGNLIANKEKGTLNLLFESYEWLSHTLITFLFGLTSVLIVPFVQIYTSGINDANYYVPTFALLITVACAFRLMRAPYNSVVNAVGHYKQTQLSAVIEASLNVIISIVLVFKFGLVGVACGTIISMLYRTVYLAYYVFKKIINRSIVLFYKRIAIDVLVFTLIFLSSSIFSCNATSYLQWVVYSCKIVIMSFIIELLVNIIVYKDVMLATLKWVIKGRNA